MKSLIVALIMVVPFAGMGQKMSMVIGNKTIEINPDSIRRGHIKFIRTKADTILHIDEKYLYANVGYSDFWFYHHKNDSVVFNLKGLWIEKYSYSYSTKKLSWKEECTYDDSDNIIGKVVTDDDSILISRTTYKYDNMNNCVETISYNGFNKKTTIEIEEIKQDGNTITEYEYSIDSLGKRKLMNITKTKIEKNKRIISCYDYEGKITSKREEKTNGNITLTTGMGFAQNGFINWDNKQKTTRKKNKTIFESSVENMTYHEETKLNDYGEATEVHSKKWKKGKVTEDKIITYSYKYDSKGNYTKKTIYLDKQPIIEINRVIGYYD